VTVRLVPRGVSDRVWSAYGHELRIRVSVEELVMPRDNSVALLAIDDAPLRQRVERALSRAVGALERLHALEEAPPRTREPSVRSALVVGSRPGGAPLTPARLRALRAMDGCVPVILCCQAHDPVKHELPRLSRSGVDAIVVLDGPDLESDLVREVLERVPSRLPASLVDDVTRSGERVPAVFREEWIARRGYRALCLADLAEWWAEDERSSRRALTGLGWRQARVGLNAGRFLHVGVYLDREEATVEEVANTLRFSDVSTMERMVRRLSGRTVLELQASGALVIALAVWKSRKVQRR
jgi:hypothetical protein